MSRPIYPYDPGDALADIEERVARLERTAQLGHSSIEGGAIEGYDGDDSLRVIVGELPDGTHGVLPTNGPPPPQPSVPQVAAIPGGVVVTWDGGNADGTDVQPLDWQRLEVHCPPTDDEPFEATAATLRRTIETPQGGTVVISTGDYDPIHIGFVARSTSGVASDPSTVATATPAKITGVDVEEFALTVKHFLDDRHHIY